VEELNGGGVEVHTAGRRKTTAIEFLIRKIFFVEKRIGRWYWTDKTKDDIKKNY